MNDSEETNHQDPWDTAKAVEMRRKFTVIQPYIKKKSSINIIDTHLKKLEKKQQ